MSHMSYAEQTGRAYCKAIGTDPDEMVAGWYNPNGNVAEREKTMAPRWSWYGGAKLDIVVTPQRRRANGKTPATRLSPSAAPAAFPSPAETKPAPQQQGNVYSLH